VGVARSAVFARQEAAGKARAAPARCRARGFAGLINGDCTLVFEYTNICDSDRTLSCSSSERR